MPKRAAGLTARQVQTKGPGVWADGGGLYLRVTLSGARMWLYRFQMDGRRRDMGLGPTDLCSLAEARQKALDARRSVAEGDDPIDARQAKRTAARVEKVKGMTFRACAEAYINAHRSGWRNAKHATQWPTTLETYVYPVLGDLPVQAIDVGLVMQVFEPLWATKTATAGRIRGRVEAILDWAAARGYRQGENPARWRGHLENLLPKKSKVARVKHHAALPYAELATFMAVLRQQEGVAARAFEFAILTAARSGEALNARWDEIDTGRKLWTLPAERMKMGREHRVPLTEAMLSIVKAMAATRAGDFVFPGARKNRPLSDTAFQVMLRRMGYADLTPHGFRSTFSDWCAEQTNFPSEVREMALAHAVGDKVEAAYRRGDMFEKRRQLAEAWSRYAGGADHEVIEIAPYRRAV